MGMMQEEDNFYSDENLSKVPDEVEVENSTTGEKEVNTDVATGDNSEEEPEAMTYSLSLDDIGSFDVEESDDTEAFSPDERLKYFSDELMANCFGERDAEVKNYSINRLLSLSNPDVFRDENYILYLVMYNYKGKVKSINIDEEFLKLYLLRNKGLITKSKGKIDIGAYGEVDGSLELGYISGVVKHFKRLLTLPELDRLEFNTVYEKYIIEYKALEAQRVYTRAQVILNDGLTIGRNTLSGFEDSYNYTRRKLAELEGVDDADKGVGFRTARELLMEEKEVNKSVKVSDFDMLESLNNVYGGIYSGMFYQVIAPPKAGKSKFLARITHTTSVKFGNNVTVWAVEGGSDAFLAELRAIHFDYTYNTGAGPTEKKYGVDQDAIVHNKFPSEELMQLEMSSKFDFASNQDYGSIDFIERSFNVETFIDDIDTSVRSNNSSVVVIDYLQLIGSTGRKDERERVAEAYKKLLVYCRQHNVAVITPGQYKQEAFEQLLSKSSTDSADMRTSAGVSSEVIRTPDIIFAFWATTKDLQNNSMKILSMPCRFNKAFPEINVLVDLGVSQFIG